MQFRVGIKMELLEDEPDVLRAEPRDGGLSSSPAGSQPKTSSSPSSASSVPAMMLMSVVFPAAGRTDEHGDVPAAHVEVDTLQDLKPRAAVAEATGNPAKP
jgi:hypothetical protein